MFQCLFCSSKEFLFLHRNTASRRNSNNNSSNNKRNISVASGSVFVKRVVARRAVYHTLNVITISLYVRPSVCVEWVLLGGEGLDPLLKKMVSEHH